LEKPVTETKVRPAAATCGPFSVVRHVADLHAKPAEVEVIVAGEANGLWEKVAAKLNAPLVDHWIHWGSLGYSVTESVTLGLGSAKPARRMLLPTRHYA